MSTIKQQKTETITVEGENPQRIVVRRMPWGTQRAFLKKFAQVVQLIIAADSKKEKIIFSEMIERVVGNLLVIVTQSDELITIICLGSTGMTVEQFDALDPVVALEVLRVSLEVNFDDEVKNSLAGILGLFVALMPARKTTSSESSTAT